MLVRTIATLNVRNVFSWFLLWRVFMVVSGIVWARFAIVLECLWRPGYALCVSHEVMQ